MTYPSVIEFKQILQETAPTEIAERYVLANTVPYVFQARPDAIDEMRQAIRSFLAVEETEIIVVGSAKIGFSLSPDTFFRSFSGRSDIDVAIVDQPLFDAIWYALLDWHYPRRTMRLPGLEWEWITERQKNLFWGWFEPERIRFDRLSLMNFLNPLRDIKYQWARAFRGLGRLKEFARRTVGGRLYRTRQHITRYHASGLAKIAADLRQTGA